MWAERCGTHVAAQHKACTPSPPPPPPVAPLHSHRDSTEGCVSPSPSPGAADTGNIWVHSHNRVLPTAASQGRSPSPAPLFALQPP